MIKQQIMKYLKIYVKEISKEDSSFYRSNDFTDTLLTANKVYTPNYYSTSLYSSTFHQPYKDFFYDKMGNADTYRNRLVTSSKNIYIKPYVLVTSPIPEKR